MQDTTDISNSNPYPAYTPPAPVTPAKPAPTTAQQTLSALTRIETLVQGLGTRLLLVEVSLGAILVGGAFLLGHVWR